MRIKHLIIFFIILVITSCSSVSNDESYEINYKVINHSSSSIDSVAVSFCETPTSIFHNTMQVDSITFSISSSEVEGCREGNSTISVYLADSIFQANNGYHTSLYVEAIVNVQDNEVEAFFNYNETSY